MKKIYVLLFICAANILSADSIVNSRFEKMSSEIYRVRNAGDDYFDGKVSPDFFDKIASGDFNRNLFHKFSDRKAWEKARKSKYADLIIAEADKIKSGEVAQLLFSEYRRFKIDGNRSGYQLRFNTRRKNMSILALALCLTGDKEKYMPRLLDHVVAVMEEFTWCVPAHAHWIKNTLIDREPVALFAGETAVTMAILHNILGEELDKEIENISEKIRRRILNTIIYATFYNLESSETSGWYIMPHPNNWTPWTAYNVLLATILLEQDNAKVAAFIRELLRVSALFASTYSDDGFCDEGPDYHGKAGMKLFTFLHLLHKIRPGSMDQIFAMPRIRAMFEFIAHIRIGKDHQVNYADGSPFFKPWLEDILMCGEVLKSDILKELGVGKTSVLGNNSDYLDPGYKLLFHLPELPEKVSPGAPFSYFKDRLAIIRSKGFSVALKAGHNMESHNHNDLGNITVYYKDAPVIVDAGSEYYTRLNFSDKRYTLWYTRGSGHNAPVFGDIEQMYGKKYTAFFERADRKKLAVNLSNAYPENANVEKFIRTVDFADEKITLKDDFKLTRPQIARIKFLTPSKVEKISRNSIKIDNVIMNFEGIELDKISTLPKMNGSWNIPLTAIEFKTGNSQYSFSFQACTENTVL